MKPMSDYNIGDRVRIVAWAEHDGCGDDDYLDIRIRERIVGRAGTIVGFSNYVQVEIDDDQRRLMLVREIEPLVETFKPGDRVVDQSGRSGTIIEESTRLVQFDGANLNVRVQKEFLKPEPEDVEWSVTIPGIYSLAPTAEEAATSVVQAIVDILRDGCPISVDVVEEGSNTKQRFEISLDPKHNWEFGTKIS